MLLGSLHTTTHTILFFCVLKNPKKSLKVCGLPVFPQSSHREGLGRGPVLIVTAYLPGWGWPPGPAALSMNAGRWWWPGTEGWVWWSLSSLLQTHRCREDIYKDISQSKYWVFNTPQLSCKPTTGLLSGEVEQDSLSLCRNPTAFVLKSSLRSQTIYTVFVTGVSVFSILLGYEPWQ